MLVQLGRRSVNVAVVDLLIECHGRIRTFLELARRLAAPPGLPRATAVRPPRPARAPLPVVEPVIEPDAEVAEIARQVARYFAEALPLHVADEDDELAPRLAGRDRDVDRALARMAAEHRQHAPAIARLIALCRVVARAPRELEGVAGELAEASARLTVALGGHLALEERVVFPAVRRLPAGEQAAIRAALRDRRERAIAAR